LRTVTPARTGFRSISPKFEGIRPVRRVPVRVRLAWVPNEVEIRVGTTASVLVKAGAGDRNDGTAVAPAPAALR